MQLTILCRYQKKTQEERHDVSRPVRVKATNNNNSRLIGGFSALFARKSPSLYECSKQQQCTRISTKHMSIPFVVS